LVQDSVQAERPRCDYWHAKGCFPLPEKLYSPPLSYTNGRSVKLIIHLEQVTKSERYCHIVHTLGV